MNSTSSRSHAVVILNMERRMRRFGSPARDESKQGGTPLSVRWFGGVGRCVWRGERRVRLGVLDVLPPLASQAKVVSSSMFMVDLAGSERVKKSGVAGMRFHELKAINLSLSALGNCIAALAARKKHIPYRDSKLTRLLQGSLGGNAKTALVVTVGPEVDSISESQSTLDFGQRARKVQVQAVVNQRVDFKSMYEDMRVRCAC